LLPNAGCLLRKNDMSHLTVSIPTAFAYVCIPFTHFAEGAPPSASQHPHAKGYAPSCCKHYAVVILNGFSLVLTNEPSCWRCCSLKAQQQTLLLW
jgi:hypothetical protein